VRHAKRPEDLGDGIHPERLYTRSDILYLLEIGPDALRSMHAEGLPRNVIGNKIYYPGSAVVQFFLDRAPKPKPRKAAARRRR
jgi:hypothetical protein